MLEMAVCKYTGVKSACNETAAQYFARYFTKDLEYWDTSNCGRLFFNTVTLLCQQFLLRIFVTFLLHEVS